MGFPVICVQSRNEDGAKTLTLTQEKFNADGSKATGYLWCVPITILTSKGKTSIKRLLKGQQKSYPSIEEIVNKNTSHGNLKLD